MFSEFDFRREVLPVLSVSLLLNLVPHYLNSTVLNQNFIFLDMSGTALAAILLGPWWAAFIGVVGSSINGLFFNSYFPFVIVNVFGGLCLGYMARATEIGSTLSGRKIRRRESLISSFVTACLLIGLVCGGLSALVKLTLYSPMGRPLDYGFAYYARAAGFLKTIGVNGDPKVWSLFVVDIFRELADKSVCLSVALVFVFAMGFLPTRLWDRWNDFRKHSLRERFKTDAASILWFIAAYSASLLLARICVPNLEFKGATHSLEWLKSPTLILLLYTPLLVSIFAFVWFSYHKPWRGLAPAVLYQRQVRQILYQRFRREVQLSASNIWNYEALRIFRKDSVYGLLVTAMLWPAKPEVARTGWGVVLFIYFAVMSAFAVLFFYSARLETKRLLQANAWLNDLHQWMRINGNSSSPNITHSFLGIMGNRFHTRSCQIRSSGQILYVMTGRYVTDEKSNITNFETAILVTPEQPAILDEANRKKIEAVIQNTRPHSALILTTTALPYQTEVVAWVEEHRQKIAGDFILLPWWDFEACAELAVRTQKLDDIFAENMIRARDVISYSRREKEGWNTNEVDPRLLRQRALPSLNHIIQRLPMHSLVVDLGAGRGRHALSALHAGHRVLAVEKRFDTCSELKTTLLTEAEESYVDVRCEDFASLPVKDCENAALIIIAGVLQHAKDEAQLCKWLAYLNDLMTAGHAWLFIEMLVDQKCDGKHLENRVTVSQQRFEELLSSTFEHYYMVERVSGPLHRVQEFPAGGRSFLCEWGKVESTVIEYLIKPETASSLH